MQELIIFQGLPRSGKSSYAFELKSKGYEVFELDHERRLITKQDYLEDDEPYVWLGVRNLVIFHLKCNKNVVIDECNPTWNCLNYWITAAKIYTDSNNLKIKIIRFTADKDTCISRCDPNNTNLINAISRKDKYMIKLDELKNICNNLNFELILK